MDNYFKQLNDINVNEHVEKKNGLSYVSWPFAWAEVKKRHPDANYTIYKNNDGWFYHTDGKTCWVETGVTINGIEHIEMLPVMDNRNKSIPIEDVTSFDVNKAIQRSLTKACARHGLGLYIYAGEDLPENEKLDAATVKLIIDAANRANTLLPKILTHYGVKKVEELTEAQAVDALNTLCEKIRRQEAENADQG